MGQLRDKQGRTERFSSAAERDAFLTKSISQLAGSLRTEQSNLKKIETDLESSRTKLQTSTENVDSAKLKLANRRGEIDSCDTEFSALKHRREDLESERKTLWRDESKLSTTLDTLRDASEKSHRTLSSTMDRNTSTGLKSVADIVHRHKIQGYFGPLYQLFSIDDVYATAVEVIAGSSLFHIVVDTDETATKILHLLNAEKKGRVTFMPLNRMRPSNVTYPDSEHALPMISKLDFDPRFEKAMKQVFGKAIITATLELASSFAKSAGVTAVSMDGDRADRKGALTGGFHDFKTSRLEAIKILKATDHQRAATESELVKIKKRIETLDVEIVAIRDSMARVEARRRTVLGNREVLNGDIRDADKTLSSIESNIESLNRSATQIRAAIEGMEMQRESYNSELGTRFVRKLNSAETKRLETLGREIEDIRVQLRTAVKDRSALEARKNVLEIETKSHERRKLDVQGQIEALSEVQIVEGNEELNALQEKIDAANERVKGSLHLI